MKQVKVFIEPSDYGFSAYMDDTPLSYACLGEGKTINQTVNDFNMSYAEMKEYYEQVGKAFEEIQYSFYIEPAAFLKEYGRIFSLAGLQRLTGVNQTQLGHYLHGRRKPSRKTVDKIQNSVRRFASELSFIRLA
ncbi:MAG: helix-turn-helix transcriptional regulator [Bacteroidales bacterium]|nr:helix-turn-helix transcriptional regulator [Bacteroidales bacterium]